MLYFVTSYVYKMEAINNFYNKITKMTGENIFCVSIVETGCLTLTPQSSSTIST